MILYCIYLNRRRRNAVLYETCMAVDTPGGPGERERRRDLSIRKSVITNTQIKCPMACYMVRASKGAATGLRLQPPKSFISDQAGGLEASRDLRITSSFFVLERVHHCRQFFVLGRATNINKHEAEMTRGARKGIRQQTD